MTITSIESLKILLSTAQASYGTLNSNASLRDDLINDKNNAGFTRVEADEFISRYELAAVQKPNTSSGFSATLFHDKIDNKYVFAIRGTEIPNDVISDLFVSDLGNIRSYGYAADQAVDLYRYWKELTADKDRTGLYTDSEIRKLYLLNHPLLNLVDVVATSADYLAFSSDLLQDKGLGAIPSGTKVDVTGHSLGGNLSYVFASMFPGNVNQVVTDNAPGVRVDGQARLSLIGFSQIDSSKVTSVDAEGDLIHLLSVTQQGSVVNISQEVGQTPIISGLANNHSVVNSVDSLNLMRLFSQIDPSQANNPTGILKDIMRASSNQALDTFENMLDALRRMVLGNSIEATPDSTKDELSLRNNLYDNIDELSRKFNESGSLHGLVGKVKFVPPSKNGLDAKGDYGQFLSLYFLTPFALSGAEADLSNLNPELYGQWKSDNNLSSSDKAAGKQNFSDTWYSDRAKFVERLIARNTIDQEIDHKSPRREIIYFNDLASATQLTSLPELVFNGRFSTDQVPTTNIFFGSDKNNLLTGNSNQDHFYGGDGNDTLKGEAGFDYLEGNAGNDLLYGGDDADQLLGGEGDDQVFGDGGNDILEGGTGNDKYIFTGTFGRDVIIDTDNSGSITINGNPIGLLKRISDVDGVYRNTQYEAVVLNEGNTCSLIITSLANRTNSITIKNWSGSGLGLQFADADMPVVDAAHTGSAMGNTDDNFISIDNYRQTRGDKDAAHSFVHLNANGGGGKNYLQGLLNGSDTLSGGAADDIINGGSRMEGLTNLGISETSTFLFAPANTPEGTDILNGNGGNDYIVVTGKNSVAHGGADNDVIRADQALWGNFVGYSDPDNAANNVSTDNVWKDFRALLNPFFTETVSGSAEKKSVTFKLGTVDPGKNTNAWTTATSVTGRSFFYIQIPSALDPNKIFIKTSYLATQPSKDKNASGEWMLSGTSQNVDWYETVANDFPNIKISDYQDQLGQYLYGDAGDDAILGSIKSDYLFGGADKDTLMGLAGHDFIDGGTGIDELWGGWGNDTLNGGDDSDVLIGNGSAPVAEALPDNDVLYGGKGDDYVEGGIGNDYLDGGINADHLYGGDGNDYLIAGTDATGNDDGVRDFLVGGIGDDTLVGNANDALQGDAGNNIYIYANHRVAAQPLPQTAAVNLTQNNNESPATQLADIPFTGSPSIQTNALTIITGEGNDTVAIAGISGLSDVAVDINGNDLLLVTPDNQQIRLQGGATNNPLHLTTGPSVEALAAAPIIVTTIDDEHFLNGIAPLEQADVTTADLILGSIVRSLNVTGASSVDYVAGGLVNDTLTARAQGSHFVGGRGDDLLQGSIVDDTYLIRKGDGNDTIIEQGGNNHIKLDKNINAADVKASRTGADLLLTIAPDQTILVKNMFNATTGALALSADGKTAIADIVFYNGDVWDINQIKQRALVGSDADELLGGFESNDQITGGKGNDQLQDGAGNDTYNYALGDGRDVISDAQGTDVLKLGQGITKSQVIARRDSVNNLILSFVDGGKVTINNAFDASGNFTANAVETIVFSDSSTWSQAQVKTEVLKNAAFNAQGSDADDRLMGDAGKEIITGGKGNDRLEGGLGDDVYKYYLGDGNDAIYDLKGNDALEFGSGINSSDVVLRSNGSDLEVLLKDDSSIFVKDMFVTKVANTVDPAITNIINQLQTRWMPQTEALIGQYYGLTGAGNLTLRFEHGGNGEEAARVNYTVNSNTHKATDITLTIDLDKFTLPNGAGPLYSDRMIAHEMVHAVMASNMDMSNLPGWFTEGAAEFIHGADERVKADFNLINNPANFAALFKTTPGSPNLSAGYSVSYLATKLLDDEIRSSGGSGIQDVFDLLKTGKSLNDALSEISLSYGGIDGLWNNLSTFETHFVNAGFERFGSLLNLTNSDTGSIAGSDYGNNPLDPNDIIPDVSPSQSSQFNLVIPPEYINVGDVKNELETIKFFGGGSWDLASIKSRAALNNPKTVLGTTGDDTLYGAEGSDTITAGKGNDMVFSFAGDDSYRYALGDGSDTITDSRGTDSIEFSANILPTQVRLKRNATDLLIKLTDRSTITVRDAFDSQGNITKASLEYFKFFDGTIWGSSQIAAELLKASDQLIQGTSNNDVLAGDKGNDTLVGGKGNDQLAGGDGDDVYEYGSGDGKDIISDSAGSDTLKLTGAATYAAVTVERDASNNLIVSVDEEKITIKDAFDAQGNFTSSAIEYLNVGYSTWDQAKIKQYLKAPALTLAGDDLNNTLVGNTGDDTLSGGRGNDNLQGGVGDDVYLYSLGDGNDSITDIAGFDTIRLGAGITPDSVVLRRSGDFGQDLQLTLSDGANIKILSTFDRWYSSTTSGAMEYIKFNDGTVWDKNKIYSKMLEGTSGDDFIWGLSSNDVITGGAGNDDLKGGLGDDVYNINLGDGSDDINEKGGDDQIQFGENITPDMVRVTSGGSAIYFYLPSHQEIYVGRIDDVTGELDVATRVETVKFADGTVWDVPKIMSEAIKSTNFSDRIGGSVASEVINGGGGSDTISGRLGDDTIAGGKGADELIGGGGNDTYYYELGDGDDKIEDDLGISTLVFGAGISSQDITLQQGGEWGNPAQITINILSGGSLSLSYQELDSIKFANGDVWSSADITSRLLVQDGSIHVLTGTSSNDTLNATVNADSYNGGAGDDSLYGGGGNDTLLGGDGNDFLIGNTGDDSLDGGLGDDVLKGGAGRDTLIGGVGNDTLFAGSASDMSGGAGNDIYYFENSKTLSRINDTAGVDEVQFGFALPTDNMSVRYDGQGINIRVSDVEFSLLNQLDSNGYFNPSTAIERFVFSDGAVWTMADIKSLALKGTDAYDSIVGFVTNDVIEGGAGNDRLSGGRGDDTYLYSRGDGYDVINDALGVDKIQFGVGIDTSQLAFEGSGGSDFSIVIREKNGSNVIGRMTIPMDQYQSRYIESIVFSDNSVMGLMPVYQSLGYDVTPPNLRDVSFSANGATITGVAEAGCAIFATNAAGVELNQIWTTTGDNGAFTYYLSRALINSEVVNVMAEDSSGNYSSIKTITAPDLTKPILQNAVFNETYTAVKGSAEAGSTITVKKGNTQLGTTVVDTQGNYSVTLSYALINKEIISVTATDLAGNISTPKSLTAPDKTPPAAPEGKFESDGKTIKGTAEAGSTVTAQYGSTSKSVTASTSGTYTIVFSTALLNYELVTLKAKDTSNNISAIREIHAPDTTPPAKPTSLVFDGSGKFITGNAEKGSRVFVKNAAGGTNAPELGSTTADPATGNFRIDLSVPLKNKESVNVYAKDPRGNTSIPATTTAPLIVASATSVQLNEISMLTIDAQLGSLIQSMAAFSPSAAAESKVLVGIYDRDPIMLASQS